MITKADRTRVTTLFNLFAEANGKDSSELLHELKDAELKKFSITEDSKPMLQMMVNLQKENQKLKEGKGEIASGNHETNDSQGKQQIQANDGEEKKVDRY